MNFSYSNLQAANLATALVARVNMQINGAAAYDEQAQVDQAPGQPGEVLMDQADSFISLSFDPATKAPKDFAFKANESLLAEDGSVVVASGTESSYLAAGSKETFSLQVPTEQGVVKQEMVLDNGSGMVVFSDGVSPAQEFSLQTLQAAQAATNLIQTLQVQIQQTAASDEQPGADQAAGQPGQVVMNENGSSVQLSVDSATSLPQNFSFKASQDLMVNGAVAVAAGMETAYQRNGNVETFRQDVPTPQGVVRQQATLDNASQTVDFQEFILKA